MVHGHPGLCRLDFEHHICTVICTVSQPLLVSLVVASNKRLPSGRAKIDFKTSTDPLPKLEMA